MRPWNGTSYELFEAADQRPANKYYPLRLNIIASFVSKSMTTPMETSLPLHAVYSLVLPTGPYHFPTLADTPGLIGQLLWTVTHADD
ncbi:unnamed protein product [Caenorhabditis auriculariae]|uniref:Uncharacterized protein n=1 Tax=Caenorhabditis auriculariae TaxID=2777116 RepID=A0A8S1HPY0_9PELO|nr:unnamed protein product [Caenorhabditis auriculariae]